MYTRRVVVLLITLGLMAIISGGSLGTKTYIFDANMSYSDWHSKDIYASKTFEKFWNYTSAQILFCCRELMKLYYAAINTYDNLMLTLRSGEIKIQFCALRSISYCKNNTQTCQIYKDKTLKCQTIAINIKRLMPVIVDCLIFAIFLRHAIKTSDPVFNSVKDEFSRPVLSKLKGGKINGRLHDILYRHRREHLAISPVTVFPFSLNQYAADVVTGNRTGEELMKYEWARYLSFKDFPQSSIMMPMRLSQAGFYYTGTGEEVKCFACGIVNSQWNLEESVIAIHRRLSPTCSFINGENNNNVTIHFREYYDSIFMDQDSVSSNHGYGFETGASGGTGVQSSATGTQREASAQGSSAQASQITPDNAQATQGQQQAKHPEYTSTEKRLESFANWTLHDQQTPRDLADAGFFYTGVRDFLRCFYCGIGLKNWVKGDKPRNEHARWSPKCGFLFPSRTTGSARTGREEPTQTRQATVTEPLPTETTGNQTTTTNTTTSVTTTQTTSTESATGTTKTATHTEKSNEAKSLKEENRNLREQMICKICMERNANLVFLPCGHMVACTECGQPLRTCAICQNSIKGTVLVYPS